MFVTNLVNHIKGYRSPSAQKDDKKYKKVVVTTYLTLAIAMIIVMLFLVVSNGSAPGNIPQSKDPIETIAKNNTSSSSQLNLYDFEENIFPKFINKFAIDFTKGLFKNTESEADTTPSVLAIANMIHTLYLVGQIEVFLSNETISNAWINTIHSFQNSTGFYKGQSSESSPLLFQPWQSTASVTAALYTLNAKPLYNNSYYANIAQHSELWYETFYPLLNYDYGLTIGCSDIHYCCHKIVAIPSVLIHEGNGEKYADFISWWFNDFLYTNLNKKYGVLCPKKDIQEVGLKTCLGSGAAQHFFDVFTNRTYPYPRKVFDFIELLSNISTDNNCIGFFDPACKTSNADYYISNMDGITQLTNSARQLNYYKWNTLVKSKCNDIINFYAPKLNNESYVLNQMSQTSLVLSPVVAAIGQCLMEFPDIVGTKYTWRCCMLGM